MKRTLASLVRRPEVAFAAAFATVCIMYAISPLWWRFVGMVHDVLALVLS